MATGHLLKHFKHHFVSHLRRSFYVAAVIASGVHILNNRNLPLELPATALLAGVAQVFKPASPENPDARRHMAVVEINDHRFEQDYSRTSPLDRCQLRDDLEALLRNENLRVLAIDLDMSPTKPQEYQEAIRSLEQGEKTLEQLDTMHRCQHELEQFLNAASKRENLSIIAISPLEPTEGRKASLAWDNPEHFPRIKFGDPRLEARFGMVHDYEFPPPGYAGARRVPFAELITQALCTASGPGATVDPKAGWLDQPKGCKHVPPAPATVEQSSPESAAASASATQLEAPPFKSYPVSHYEVRHIYNRGFPIGLGSPCLSGRSYDPESRQEPCDIRVVVFGGTYGSGDEYLTAVGKMSGLQLHAAIAAQVRAHTWHGWGFLGDVLLGGLILGPLVHWMWSGYYRQRTGSVADGRSTRHPGTAYLWLVSLGSVYLAVVGGLAYFSTGLYAARGIWISPVSMALAMAFESAVSGSVHAAVDKVEHEVEHARTTISGLERTISELRSTAGAIVEQARAQDGGAVGRTPWLAYLPRAAAVSMIVLVVGGLFFE